MLISVCLGACGVKIETGQTREEAVESSRDRGSRIRAEWANQVDAAPPAGKVDLLLQHVGGVTDRYLDFGNRIAREWREAEQGRGETVSSEEMRRMIDAWTGTEKPILKANDDNVEYARRQIVASGMFSQTFIERLDEMVERYYDVFSTVFYPTEDLDSYEADLDAIELEMADETESLERELRVYR